MLWEFVISWDNLKNVVISTQRDNKKRIYEATENKEKSRKCLYLRDYFLLQRKYKIVQKHMKKSVQVTYR